MIRSLFLFAPVLLGLAGTGCAQAQNAARADAPAQPPARRGAPAVVVAPLDVDVAYRGNRIRLPVGTDGTEYTLIVPKTLNATDRKGDPLRDARLKKGWWIRAAGTVAADARSIQVDSLQVLGTAKEAAESVFYRAAEPKGYALVGREGQPALLSAEPTAVVGRILDDPESLHRGAYQARVKAGVQEWQLRLQENAQVVGPGGERVLLRSLPKGTWVRAEGWQTGEQTLRVVHLRQVAQDPAGYRSSEVYRPGFDAGYAVHLSLEQMAAPTFQIEGRVTKVNTDPAYLVVHSDDGREHTVYPAGTRLFRAQDNRPVEFAEVREGQVVQAVGRLIGTGRP